MELKIINPESDNFYEQLGITKQRTDELNNKVSAIDYMEGGQSRDKAVVFKELVELCDNLQEVVAVVGAYQYYIDVTEGICL